MLSVVSILALSSPLGPANLVLWLQLARTLSERLANAGKRPYQSHKDRTQKLEHQNEEYAEEGRQ